MTMAGTPSNVSIRRRERGEPYGSGEARPELLVVDRRRVVGRLRLEDVRRRPAVDDPVPVGVGPGEHDLVLDPRQRRLATDGLVAQRVPLDVHEHVCHPGTGQRLEGRLLRFAGDVRIPDLECTGDVTAVATQ